MKNPASKDAVVKKGKADKADITVAVGDDDFVSLATGKLNGVFYLHSMLSFFIS